MVAGVDQYRQVLLHQRMLHDLRYGGQGADADLRPFERDAGEFRDMPDIHQRLLEPDLSGLALGSQVGAAGEDRDIAPLETLDRLVEAGRCEVVFQFGHLSFIQWEKSVKSET
jgi:hypothetical protein